jgi:acyl-ACP thioesterase
MDTVPKKNTWEEAFTVRAYEVDPAGQLTIQSICNYLQEVAGNHAQQLGVAVDQLLKQNLTWVLSRLHIRIERYPFWRETLTIETWPAAVDRFYAIRDYRVTDSKLRPVVAGTSSWMLIDIRNRRPVALPEHITSMHNNSPGRAIDDPFKKLPGPDEAHFSVFFNVRRNDLDMNNHVNNVNYIEWGLESVPENLVVSHRLKSMEISFKAESRFGERIRSVSERFEKSDEVVFHHQLVREADSKELARM